MYLRVTNSIIEYPFHLSTLKAENPNVSFPREMSEELLAGYGVFGVAAAPEPTVTIYEKVVEGVPSLVNDQWTQTWTVVPADVPPSITPRQCRLLLLQQGLLSQVEVVIAQQDEATKITWEYALEFRRDDPLLTQLAISLTPPLTPEQIDHFFIAAAQL